MINFVVICGGFDGGVYIKVFGMGYYGIDLIIWMVCE